MCESTRHLSYHYKQRNQVIQLIELLGLERNGVAHSSSGVAFLPLVSSNEARAVRFVDGRAVVAGVEGFWKGLSQLVELIVKDIEAGTAEVSGVAPRQETVVIGREMFSDDGDTSPEKRDFPRKTVGAAQNEDAFMNGSISNDENKAPPYHISLPSITAGLTRAPDLVSNKTGGWFIVDDPRMLIGYFSVFMTARTKLHVDHLSSLSGSSTYHQKTSQNEICSMKKKEQGFQILALVSDYCKICTCGDYHIYAGFPSVICSPTASLIMLHGILKQNKLVRLLCIREFEEKKCQRNFQVEKMKSEMLSLQIQIHSMKSSGNLGSSSPDSDGQEEEYFSYSRRGFLKARKKVKEPSGHKSRSLQTIQNFLMKQESAGSLLSESGKKTNVQSKENPLISEPSSAENGVSDDEVENKKTKSMSFDILSSVQSGFAFYCLRFCPLLVCSNVSLIQFNFSSITAKDGEWIPSTDIKFQRSSLRRKEVLPEDGIQPARTEFGINHSLKMAHDDRCKVESPNPCPYARLHIQRIGTSQESPFEVEYASLPLDNMGVS
ncbi:hypothetical protein SADUNF_Sadunf02G0157100 [Salix dunnii]|uniref:Uncharacterized protein n=1 Tax=Salix dunnii TaxID=1413687 RepID=A0A835N885_9ROSI|nr:hypothetical protein SADUNF_Sadunf02G0157100 [Salix dunnii]